MTKKAHTQLQLFLPCVQEQSAEDTITHKLTKLTDMTDKRTEKTAEYLVFAECNHALIGCVCRSKDVWGVF